jgi:TRAP-type C4-dicarboxylate transport system substrate-binding protein
MTPAQQKIFNDTGIEAAKYRMTIQKELETKRLEDLKKLGMQVIEPPSLDPFRKIAQGIAKKYREKYQADKWGEYYDKVVNIGKK